MMLVAPMRLMSSRASCMLPSPKAISAMTAPVPMMMPSTERKARSLCSHRVRKASTRLRRPLSEAKTGKTSTAMKATASSVSSQYANIRASNGGVAVGGGLRGCHHGVGRGQPGDRAQAARVGVALVGLDVPVPHADDAAGPGGDVVLVRDHDDGLALGVEPGEHLHDLVG